MWPFPLSHSWLISRRTARILGIWLTLGLVLIGLALPLAALGDSVGTPAHPHLDMRAAGQDVDGDGLSNEHERNRGTNPYDLDTDGDELLDSWEVRGRTPTGAPLQGTNPRRMDLFVQVYYADDVPRLTMRERRQLRQAWRSMPVENPNGQTGIALHLLDGSPTGGRITTPVTDSPLTTSRLRRLNNQFYTADRLGDRRCIDHVLLFTNLTGSNVSGRSIAPGYFSVADGTNQRTYGGSVTFRGHLLIHEVLHNIVGELDTTASGVRSGGQHTSRGWLARDMRNATSNEYLSPPVIATIEQEGFSCRNGRSCSSTVLLPKGAPVVGQ